MHTPSASSAQEMRILHDLSFLGHYLYVNRGGRGGQQFVLTTLYAYGAMTQKELLSRTLNASASLSEVISKLESEGLVTRTRSEEDRRQFIVSLTELGTKRALEEEVKRQAFLDKALACVNEAEQTALLATLDTLVAHWKTLEKSKKGEALCQQK